MNKSDPFRNAYGLTGSLAKKGYMRWWHSFRGTGLVTGKVRTFFIEYMIMNPGLGSDKPIWGLHPYYRKRGMKPSYFLVKAGVLPSEQGDDGKQLHRFFAMDELAVSHTPFVLQADDCFYSEGKITGVIDVCRESAAQRFLQTDAGNMSWQLEVLKTISCHTGFIASPLFTALNALESFWHGEGIQCYFRGRITLDGEEYQVSTGDCFGYADKHWGRTYNHPWLQFATSHLTSSRTGKLLKHSALAIDGSSSRFLFFPLRKRLNLQLTYTGEDYDFTFANLLKLPRIKWDSKEKKGRLVWHIKARNRDILLKMSVSAPLKTMMPIHYETTDGRRHKQPLLGSAFGQGWVEIYRNTPDGTELVDRLLIHNALCEYRNAAR